MRSLIACSLCLVGCVATPRISGTVATEDGVPLVGAEIATSTGIDTHVKRNGTYAFHVPRGASFLLTAALGQASPARITFEPESFSIVNIQKNETRSFTGTPWWTISVPVVWADGTPQPGVAVRAVEHNVVDGVCTTPKNGGLVVEAVTDMNGIARLVVPHGWSGVGGPE